jgi:tRNA 2-thiouridine synthesizing protein A
VAEWPRPAATNADRSTKGASTMNIDKELDARGLNCPLPIIKTKKALNDLTSGQVLRVTSTDSGSVKDMEAFARQTGNELLQSAEEGGSYVFLIKKK